LREGWVVVWVNKLMEKCRDRKIEGRERKVTEEDNK
jgi:hypothetical protein